MIAQVSICVVGGATPSVSSVIMEEFYDYVTDDLMPLLEKVADVWIDEGPLGHWLVVDGQKVMPCDVDAIEKQRVYMIGDVSDAVREVFKGARGYFGDGMIVKWV